MPIIDANAFYRKIRIKWNSKWIPFILSHPLLIHRTKCNGMTIIDRLAQELNFNVFKMVALVRGNNKVNGTFDKMSIGTKADS